MRALQPTPAFLLGEWTARFHRVCAVCAQSCESFATPWTVACQSPLSMEFSRVDHWSGLPFPSPGDLSNPGTEPRSPPLQADALPSESPRKPEMRNLLAKRQFLWMCDIRREVKSLNCVWLFDTPWTVAYRASLSMGFSRQEYWSGLLFPPPGESSWPKDQIRISHNVGRCFTIWATREVIVINFFFPLAVPLSLHYLSSPSRGRIQAWGSEGTES